MSKAPKVRKITKWNILALLAALIGTGITLTADQLWLKRWAESGLRHPVAQRFSVELQPGDVLVYYQSLANIVPDRIRLDVKGPDGTRVRALPAPEENNFRLLLGGIAGRSLWQLTVTEPGVYDIGCTNGDYGFDEIPVTDEIVLFKTPSTLAEATAGRKVVQLVGASITLGFVIVLYMIHAHAIRRSRASVASAIARDDLDDLDALDPR